MKTQFDTIILGAGFSGLSAGVRLAQFGQKVLILEQHNLPGGLNSYYYRSGKRLFNTGLHTVTNFDARNRRWGRGLICRSLGIPEDAFQLKSPSHPSLIITPDHRIPFSNDFELFETAILSRFPKEKAAWHQFCNELNNLSVNTQWFELGSRDRLRALFKDPGLCDLLEIPVYYYGGYREKQIDYQTFKTIFRSLLVDGHCCPVNIKHIIDLLLFEYKKAGGIIRYRSRVEELLPTASGDRAEGLVLQNGEILRCGNVLSSIGIPATHRLMGKQSSPRGNGFISAFETTYEFPGKMSDYGFPYPLVMLSQQKEFDWTMPKQRNVMHHLTISANDNYEFADRGGTHHLKLAFYTDGRLWDGLAEGDYIDEKQKLEKALRNCFQDYFQDVQIPVSTYRESMTAKTVTRYTGHLNGAVYGSMEKAFDGKTPWQNVSIIGNDQGGIGIMGAMISGIVMANFNILLKP